MTTFAFEMKTLKKIGIQLLLIITVLCCIEVVAYSIIHESEQLTELAAEHSGHGNTLLNDHHADLHLDDIIHDVNIIRCSASYKVDHLHFHKLSVPCQHFLSIWQPPQFV